MSTFEPSKHSANSYAGYAGPVVKVENLGNDELGFFIAESNEGMSGWSFAWMGLGLAASIASFGISYHKNKSIGWALATGLPLIRFPALAYYTVTGETGKAWKAAKKSFA